MNYFSSVHSFLNRFLKDPLLKADSVPLLNNYDSEDIDSLPTSTFHYLSATENRKIRSNIIGWKAVYTC
jgi:hypothetical protein